MRGSCLVLIAVTMSLVPCAAPRPKNLGIAESRLAPCPSSPNCVSSDARDSSHSVPSLELAEPGAEGWQAARASEGIIAVRSASRVGYGDLGVNRRRVEKLRSLLAREDIVRPSPR